jgi:hypothetical protein
MHVDRGASSAKLWLDPDVRFADAHGYSRRELREIERTAREHVEQLRDEWDRFCTGADGAA